ncbi:MAG: YfhO family protein [Leptolinea sp.]|jgi:hypothetical protein|nr:YfhO family protein [Leptolinea sp.]
MNENNEIKKSIIARMLVLIVPFSYLLFYLVQGYSILVGNTDRVDAQLTAIFAAKNAIEVGQMPWWNPYIFNGYPLWGSPNVFLWYPFTWIELLVPRSMIVQTSTIIAWLHYFAVFLTSFLYFREITHDEKWASFSSLAYGFSIPVAYGLSIGNAHIPIYVYLPLLLFFLHTFRKRKFTNNVLAISLSLYAMITGGFMQLFVYAMIIIGCYFIFLLLDSNSKTEKINLFLMLLASSVIALFLSAPVWLSTFFMSKYVSRVLDTGTSLRMVINSNYMADLYQWLRLFAPNGFGYSMYVQEKNISYVETMVVFCGVSCLYLAGIALINSRKKITAFWGIITIFWLLLVYSLVELVQYFAFGRMEMMYGRILFLLPLCLAGLAGIGGQSLQEKSPIKKWKLILYSPFNILLIIAIHGNARYIHDLLRNIGQFFGEFVRTHRLSLAPEMLPEIETTRVVLILIIMIIIVLIRKMNTLQWGVLIIVLLSEVIPGTYYMNKIQLNPLMISPTSELFAYDKVEKPIPFSSSYLEKYRIVVSEETPSRKNDEAPILAKDANQGSVYGYYSPWGYANGYSANLAQLIQTVGTIDWTEDCASGGIINDQKDIYYSSLRQVVFDPSCHPRLSDLMSVGAVIKADSDWEIIEDRESTTIPRASLFYDYQVIPDSNDASLALAQDDFSYKKTLVLNKSPEQNIGQGDSTAVLIFEKNTPNEIIITVNTKSSAILLLTDNYYPGWNATIDSQPTEIFRANVAFRSVWIPEGKHTVVFSYHPPLLKVSLLLMFFGVMILIAIRMNSFFLKNMKNMQPV